jgi:hypothetical protein
MNSPDHEKEPNPVSSNVLARWFGVSPKVIYDLEKAGIIEHGPGRLFPLEESVRRYCDYLRLKSPMKK